LLQAPCLNQFKHYALRKRAALKNALNPSGPSAFLF